MTQTLVFKYALKPTLLQEQILASHIGAVRFSYNWALANILKNWDEVKQNPTLPYKSFSAYSLRKELNFVKNNVAPWWEQNSKEAFATGTANASTALKNWFRGRKIGVGFPRFKTRNHDTKTGIVFTTGTRRLEKSNRHFTLPRIGQVRLHETAKTLRWLLAENGKISNVTVRKENIHWFIAINIQVTDALALQYFNGRKKHKRRKSAIGIDVGLKVFLTTSEGTTIENPAFLRKSLTKLRKANKRLARRKKLNKKTGEIASNRWDKAHNTLTKTHNKIVNQRKNFLHTISKELVSSYDLISIENLNVKGMVKNRHLSLSISDVGWGEFRRQLDYKSSWYDSKLFIVDRFYPSSKTCSGCGVVKIKLSLNERTFECLNCGLVVNRDLNAALNIKAVAQSCGETLNERGEGSSGLANTVNETTLNETLRE